MCCSESAVRKRRRSEEFPLTSFVYPHSSWCAAQKEKLRRNKKNSIENWVAFTLLHSNQLSGTLKTCASIFNHTIIFHLYCYCLSILFFSIAASGTSILSWYRLTRIHHLCLWIANGIKIRNLIHMSYYANKKIFSSSFKNFISLKKCSNVFHISVHMYVSIHSVRKRRKKNWNANFEKFP